MEMQCGGYGAKLCALMNIKSMGDLPDQTSDRPLASSLKGLLGPGNKHRCRVYVCIPPATFDGFDDSRS